MAKLVDVYHSDEPLNKRQLPLVLDENFTLVMDLSSMGLICEHKQMRSKEQEEFAKKISLLTKKELREALKASRNDMLKVLNQSVPCVGCRRSVERLFYQLYKFEYPTFDPLLVTREEIITVRDDVEITPQVLCTLFHGHSTKLNNVVDSQPRRSKRSHRCLLHSLDSQRNRPLTTAWRDVWDCMHQQCKEEVVLIESSTLHTTLENYLRKHRFCSECRTKVQKAYTLLVGEPEPHKEKGYVASLYAGIKMCLPDKHLHLQTKTDYITKLISRAEPELLGSRRERHAKTLEIAQEEVLTCLGICVYERLHRIYMRMREEECTCQVFAAVAVDTLCRNFETAVEAKQGVSALELCEQFEKEEQLKQQRRELKKLKKRRRKDKIRGSTADADEGCVEDDVEPENECYCPIVENERSKEQQPSYEVSLCGKKKAKNKSCAVPEDAAALKIKDTWQLSDCECVAVSQASPKKSQRKNKKIPMSPVLCDCEFDVKDSGNIKHDKIANNINNNNSAIGNGKEAIVSWSSNSDHSHDCGYSSENNNGCCETVSPTSSLPSTPEGSDIACQEECCNQDCQNYEFANNVNGFKLSLSQMLEDSFATDDEGEESYIPEEDVIAFHNKACHITEKRRELRLTLQKRFAQLCLNGPQTKLQIFNKSDCQEK